MYVPMYVCMYVVCMYVCMYVLYIAIMNRYRMYVPAYGIHISNESYVYIYTYIHTYIEMLLAELTFKFDPAAAVLVVDCGSSSRPLGTAPHCFHCITWSSKKVWATILLISVLLTMSMMSW